MFGGAACWRAVEVPLRGRGTDWMQQSGSVLALLGSSHAKVSHTPRAPIALGVSTQPTRPPALANLRPYQEHPPTVGRPVGGSYPLVARARTAVLGARSRHKLRRSDPKQMGRRWKIRSHCRHMQIAHECMEARFEFMLSEFVSCKPWSIWC